MVEKDMTNDEKSSRKLASIQIISELKEHSNADKLLIATVLGWNVVCGKSDGLIVGDKVIYFEIDSLLPSDKIWSAFMKDKKFRIKTVKLRGELSQGLLMPLKILEEYNISIKPEDYTEGQDMTQILQIVKYENDADEEVSPNNKNKIKINSFPSQYGFEKTDEPRIQSSPGLLKEFKDKAFYATLKYDGTSCTYFVDKDKDEFYICSRNQIRGYDKSECYTKTADKYNIKEILIKNSCKYAIQGETYGPSIQKNPLEVKEICFAVFNIYDYQDKKYLDYDALCAFCKENSLPMVEVIVEGDNFNYSLSELKELSKGNYKNTKNPREGLVFRLKSNWNDLVFKRFSFKIINDDYLLNKK